jgi:hypothetical protein
MIRGPPAFAAGRGGQMLGGHGEDLDFGDLFAADPAGRDRLEQIAATVRPNDSAPMVDFSLVADPDQEAFIASEAATIRLLAPAGSGRCWCRGPTRR